MAKKPTTADAQLILQLYDLRREAEMRKARSWWVNEFWPNSADDFIKVAFTPGTAENNWLRQVLGYWSMASSFVLHGALNSDLFLQPAVSGEMFIIFAKVQPFLKELREKSGDTQMFGNIEKSIMSSKFGRERMKFMLEASRDDAGKTGCQEGGLARGLPAGLSNRPVSRTLLFAHPRVQTHNCLTRRFLAGAICYPSRLCG